MGSRAAAAYGLSFLFSFSGGSYRLLFVIGAAAMILALTIDLVANRSPKSSQRRPIAAKLRPARQQPGTNRRGSP
jgi:hypothetical protein